MVADASALDFEINPNPLQRKQTPLARRYPRFPVPLHFVQQLEVDVIVVGIGAFGAVAISGDGERIADHPWGVKFILPDNENIFESIN